MSDDLRAVLKALNQRPVAYYPCYARIMGSAAGGIVLSQLLFYYAGSPTNEFTCKDERLRGETGVSEREFREAKQCLKTLSFLTVTRKGLPAQTWYEVSDEALWEAIARQTSINAGVQSSSDTGVPTGVDAGVPTYKEERFKEILEENKTPPLPPSEIMPDVQHIECFEQSFTMKSSSTDSQKVLDYLNSLTGRKYNRSGYITTLLKTGTTVEQCCCVLDFLHIIRRAEDPQWTERYLDNVTPFKAENFDKYRARAEQWDIQGRPAPVASVPRNNTLGRRTDPARDPQALKAYMAQLDAEEHC